MIKGNILGFKNIFDSKIYGKLKNGCQKNDLTLSILIKMKNNCST